MMCAKKIKFPEIAAPAGNSEMMTAAVENGAGAVYFGLSAFNARMRADNFKDAELHEIVASLHQRGVKAYVTLNTLFFSNEIEKGLSLYKLCSDAGVDGVMVQDIGMAYLVNRLLPDLPLCASTQMTLTSASAIKGIGDMGIKLSRVVLARELSIDEIEAIRKDTDIELEVFIHGALCISYSGQCLASESIGGRSANRGLCAQPCRLPYTIIADGKVWDTKNRNYPLSPKDLCAYENIGKLMNIGVDAFKIEGRLKTPYYVAETVRIYKDLADRVLKKKEDPNNIKMDSKTKSALEYVFSRGFTKGWMNEKNNTDVVDGVFSGARGPYAGEVISVSNNEITARVDRDLKPGDGILFSSLENNEGTGGRIFQVRDKKNKLSKIDKPGIYVIVMSRETFKSASVKPGASIYKTGDQARESIIRKSWAENKNQSALPVNAWVTGSIKDKIKLTLRDNEGNSVEVEDTELPEKAINMPLDKDLLAKYIGRMGNTPFYLNKLECNVDGRLMVPPARLNELRRKAVEMLAGKVRQKGTDRKFNSEAIKEVDNELRAINVKTPKKKETVLNILCRTVEQFARASDIPGINQIYFEPKNEIEMSKAVEVSIEKRKHFVPVTPRITRIADHSYLEKLMKINPEYMLVRNPDSFYQIKSKNDKIKMIADFSFNTANEYSALVLLKSGFERVTLSADMNLQQIISMSRNAPAGLLEATIHQHFPMFHTEYCIFCRFLGKGKNNQDCGRPCLKHKLELSDRKNIKHPVVVDQCCRNTVFNGVVQSACPDINEITKTGINNLRIEFLYETPGQMEKLIKLYQRFLASEMKANDLKEELEDFYPYGVMQGTFRFE